MTSSVCTNKHKPYATTTLVLNGEELVLKYIELDGVRLFGQQILQSEEALHITNVPDSFEIRNSISLPDLV